MHRPTIAAAIVLCPAILTAACSANSTSSSASGARSTTGAGPAAAARSTAASPAIPGSGNVPAFCALITKNNAILMDIAAGDTSSTGVDATKLLHDLDAAAAAAPAEVKTDMQTIVDFDRQLITKHTDIQETPQLEAAMQHYATWTRAHCVGKP